MAEYLQPPIGTRARLDDGRISDENAPRLDRDCYVWIGNCVCPRTAVCNYRGYGWRSSRPNERIRSHLGYERLEEARIPVHVVTTEVRTGNAVVLSTGNAVLALLASAAIPGGSDAQLQSLVDFLMGQFGNGSGTP